MIRINTAKSGTRLAYSATRGFGPFSPDGEDVFESFEIRSSFDDLRERPGFHGENHVNHSQFSAELFANPYHGIYTDLGANIKLYQKTPSGGWSSSNTLIKACDLAPAYPWTLVYRSGATSVYRRKHSPVSIDSMEVRGSYIGGVWRANTILVDEFRATSPTKGSKLVDSTWHAFSRLSTQESIVINYDGTKNFHLLESLFEIAKLGRSSYLGASSLLYPFFHKLPPVAEHSYRDIYSAISNLPDVHYDFPTDIKSYGDLAGEAVDALDRNSINMFEFIQGIKRPWELVPKLKNLSKLKTHAGNYLGYEYGIMPTISDLETLRDAVLNTAKPYFDSNNYQVVTAGHSASRSNSVSDVTLTNRIKIAINPSDGRLNALSERLRDIGTFPSVDNLWDLVPYSFVIDWFINVGDMLESLDDRFRIATLPIEYVTRSSKLEIRPKLPESLKAMGVHGTVLITLYDRSVSRRCPEPTLSFEVSNSLPDHWLEASALIVTARK